MCAIVSHDALALVTIRTNRIQHSVMTLDHDMLRRVMDKNACTCDVGHYQRVPQLVTASVKVNQSRYRPGVAQRVPGS